MALVKCPQCGEKISDKAVTCPHCKAQILVFTHKNKNKDVLAWKIIISIFVFFGGISLIVPLFYPTYLNHDRAPIDAINAWFYLGDSSALYFTIGYGLIGGLLSIGLSLFGIIRIKDQTISWRYWLVSIVIATVLNVGNYYILEWWFFCHCLGLGDSWAE